MKKSIILILLLSLFLVTLYACVFESVDVKVYFHYNNEDYTDYQTDGKTGYKVTAPDDPKMDNYLFAGWFTEDDQKWNFKSNKLKSDLSLYAKYTLDGLDIYYLNDFH
ncbi:InlB B-repeat-containing protein, partial [Acholeplasma sp. OttesenSCG-928-E16]|nr:InlB B-repeat-containing protein [Acholeplasma sp. OttesenSCG-928-E16]